MRKQGPSQSHTLVEILRVGENYLYRIESDEHKVLFAVGEEVFNRLRRAEAALVQHDRETSESPDHVRFEVM